MNWKKDPAKNCLHVCLRHGFLHQSVFSRETETELFIYKYKYILIHIFILYFIYILKYIKIYKYMWRVCVCGYVKTVFSGIGSCDHRD